MKSLQAPNLKTTVLTKTMYTTIRSYDKQAFDNMSEQSEKKKLYHEEIVAACSKSRHGRAGRKKMAASDPSEVTQDAP